MTWSRATLSKEPAKLPTRNDAALFTDADAVRYEILQTAKHRFARFGYEGTSLADVARASYVSAAEMWLHFTDKLSLLTAVFDEGWESINLRLQDIVIDSANARQAALTILAVMMQILEKDEDFARLILFEGRRSDPESGEIVLSKGLREFTRLWTELVMRGQNDGSFSMEYSPQVIVSILIGAVENLMRDRILSFQEGRAPSTGRELLTAFDALVSYMRPQRAL